MTATKAPKEITSVTMDDGRIVEFSGKKRLDKTVIVAEGKVSIRLDFLNGETRTFTVPDTLLLQFAGHGASQKLGDEISDVAKVEDAIEVIDTLMQRLEAGKWQADRATGPSSGLAGASVLAKALVKVTGQPITVVRDYLGGLDGKTKAALRQQPAVATVIRELEAEAQARAAASGKGNAAADQAKAVLDGLMVKAAA